MFSTNSLSKNGYLKDDLTAYQYILFIDSDLNFIFKKSIDFVFIPNIMNKSYVTIYCFHESKKEASERVLIILDRYQQQASEINTRLEKLSKDLSKETFTKGVVFTDCGYYKILTKYERSFRVAFGSSYEDFYKSSLIVNNHKLINCDIYTTFRYTFESLSNFIKNYLSTVRSITDMLNE